MHQVGPRRRAAGFAETRMVDEDMGQPVGQRGLQNVPGEDRQVAPAEIDVSGQFGHCRRRIARKTRRTMERLADQGLQGALQPVEEHAAAEPDGIGLAALARFPRQPFLAAQAHHPGPAEQVVDQFPVGGHLAVGGIRGRDIGTHHFTFRGSGSGRSSASAVITEPEFVPAGGLELFRYEFGEAAGLR
jgi:hypothetical protein